MAEFSAIAAVGLSIERYLNACFDASEPIEGRTTNAVLIRTEDMEESQVATRIGSPALSIYLYRVGFDPTMRPAWSAAGHRDGRSYLALDLHYLLAAWAENAEFEHRILGRALQCLEAQPVLRGPLLHASGGFSADESIQLVLEELSTEGVMRTYDSLPTEYRLSVPYQARIVRIDGLEDRSGPPVVTAIAGARPTTEAP